MQGVFTLWDGAECVYVGHTPGNRSLLECLRRHLALLDEGVIHASHFTWETTSTPKSRERQLLARLARAPRYNSAGSPLAVTEPVTDLRAPR